MTKETKRVLKNIQLARTVVRHEHIHAMHWEKSQDTMIQEKSTPQARADPKTCLSHSGILELCECCTIRSNENRPLAYTKRRRFFYKTLFFNDTSYKTPIYFRRKAKPINHKSVRKTPNKTIGESWSFLCFSNTFIVSVNKPPATPPIT